MGLVNGQVVLVLLLIVTNDILNNFPTNLISMPWFEHLRRHCASGTFSTLRTTKCLDFIESTLFGVSDFLTRSTFH